MSSTNSELNNISVIPRSLRECDRCESDIDVETDDYVHNYSGIEQRRVIFHFDCWLSGLEGILFDNVVKRLTRESLQMGYDASVLEEMK